MSIYKEKKISIFFRTLFVLVFILNTVASPLIVYSQNINNYDTNSEDDYERFMRDRERNQNNNQTTTTQNNTTQTNDSAASRNALINAYENAGYDPQQAANQADLDIANQGVVEEALGSPATQQRANTASMTGFETLYPAGADPTKAFDPESYGVDFVSCVGGLMAVEALKIPINMLDNIGDYVSSALFNGLTTLANNIPLYGSAAVNASILGTAKNEVETSGTSDSEKTEILEIGIVPAREDIAFCLKNVFVARMTMAITDWIDEGANEAAAYVEDFEEVLNDVAALSYQKAIGDANICVNIKGQVDFSVLSNWLRRKRAETPSGRCTLIFDREYELMLRGRAFSYDKFNHLTQNPRNNVMGATLLGQSLAEEQNQLLEKKYTAELGWSKGFWSWVDADGRTTTPGQMITQKLFSKLDVQDDTVAMTDDFDRVMLMISNQLIKKVIQDGI